jgi:uncharacterized protein (TIGR02145 family)
MNELISTHKKEAWSFFKTVIVLFLFIMSGGTSSAQEEFDSLVKPDPNPQFKLGPQLIPDFSQVKKPVYIYPNGYRFSPARTTQGYQPLFQENKNSGFFNNGGSNGPLSSSSQCPNSDFSYGNFTNWSGCWGPWSDPTYQDPCSTLPHTWTNIPNGGHFSIQTPGPDPYIPALQKVFPGDPYSALIGNRVSINGGGNIDRVTYQIAYDPANSFFIYRTAVVLNNPNSPDHNTVNKKPRFTFEIKDAATGVLVDPICGFYDLTPGDGNNWQTAGPPVGTYVWMDWTTIGIDLNALTGLIPGQLLNLVFTVHGCGWTAHTGYAYISAFCGTMTIQNTGCNGSGSITFTGPPGFTQYQWQGPFCPSCAPIPPIYYGNPITFTAAQGAVTGNTFVLNLTAPNGCQVQNVQQIIAFTTINAGFTDTLGCSQRPSYFYDTSIVSQNAVTAWRWFFGDPASGASDSSHLKNPIHSFSAAGLYNVKLISYSTEGCPDTATLQVNIGDLVTITNTGHRSQICSGQHAVIPLTANFPDALYTWTATASSGSITGFSGNAVPALSPIDQILVNNGTNVDSVTYIITPHEGSCNGDPFTFRVVVFPKPGVTFNPPAPLICSGQTTNILLTPTVTGTTFTWTAIPGSPNVSGWGPGSGFTIAQTLSTPGIGTETVTYRVVPTANGCPGDTANLLVTVKPKPHLVTDPMNQTICSKTPTNIVLTSSSGPTAFTWNSAVVVGNVSGNSGGAGTPITQILTDNLSTQGQVDYTIHMTSGGCTGNDTIYSVYVNPRPNVTTAPLTASICSNTATSISLLSDVVSGVTFTWIATGSSGNVTGYSSGAGPSITQTLLNPGPAIETVTYHIVASANGCDGDTAYFIVTVHPLPIPAIVGSASVCLNSTTVYGTTAGMTNYTWIVSAGGTIVLGAGTNSISVNWTTIGAQTISVNYTDPFGCVAASPTVFNVDVSLIPVPGLVGSNSVCIGSSSTYSSDPGMAAYVWVVSAGGTITAGGGASDNSATVHWTVLGAQTVSVNYEAGPGCTAPSPTLMNVTIQPLPVPAIGGSNSVCVGSTGNIYTAQAGMTGYTWSVSAGGTITAGGTAGDAFATITWNVAGAQTVSVNFTNANGCTALAPTAYPVTVHVLPLPAIAGPTNVCDGTTGVVYSTLAGQTNYLWTLSGGGIITAGGTTTDNTVTITWNATGIHTLTVNYNDANGCTAVSPTSYNVNIYTLPVPFIGGSNKICTGTTGVIYTTQAGMTNYLWAVSAGGIITGGGTINDNTVTVTWNTPGANTVSVNFNDPNGCTAVSATSYPVTVDPLPVPNIVGNNNLCAGSTGVVYSTQPGMTNYTWSVSAGGTITAGGSAADNTVTVTWNTAGAQTVTINYHDLNGCTAVTPFVYPVTVHPLPVPAIAGLPVVCAGSTGIVYTTQPGNSNYAWFVSGGGTITGGGGANDNTVTVTWNTPGAQSVSVNYHDGNGCTAVSPTVYPVTINALPVPVITGPAAICLNTTGTYSTAAGMSIYSWTVTAGGNITSGAGTNSITVAWTTLGAQSITVNYFDANGCTAASPTTYNVTVNTLPTPNLGGLNSICLGFSAVYTTDFGMTNYSWSISAGGTITAGGGANDNTVTVHWTVAGPQTVSVNYVVGTGCTAPAPSVYNVTVHALPNPMIAGTSILCAGPALYVYSTQPGMTTYQWTVSAGGIVTAGGGNADNTVTVKWPTAGAQTVTINYHDANGCTALASTSYPVTVNPLPLPTISGAASVCLNSTSVYFTEAGMVNYIWSVSAGGTITAGMGTNSITVLWNTIGPKSITVNYNDANGCTAPAPSSFIVTVNTLPTPSLAGLNTICSGLSTVYTTDAGMTTYSWNISAGGSVIAGGGVTDFTVTVLWNTAGAQTVSVNYVMGTGCTAPAPTVYNVTVKPRPSITNAANSSMCSSGTTNIIPSASLPGTTFSWTATGSSGNVTGFNPGAGFSITDNLVNSGFNIETVNYAVTPSLNGCDGPVAHYIVTVNPVADVYFNPNGQSFCSGGTTNINILSHTVGATFTWTATGSSGNVTGYGPGAGNLIAQTLTNSGPYFENVNYDVFPLANGCPGSDSHVIVNTNPTPAVSLDMNCNAVITTSDAKPITLKGGIPLGGVYSGTGVNAGVFFPSLAGPGTFAINYSYGNTWGCNANQSQNITVIGAVVFPCNNILIDIRDNKQYPTVKIGAQCWMAMNLDRGTQIASTAMQRDNCVTEKYCYNDLVGNCTSLGGLYQWDEMMRFEDLPALQGICPPSWHVPTENDWTTLFNFYTSNGFAGSPLKFSGFSGFDAFLDGVRFDNANWNFTNFATFFWSSTSRGPNKAWAHAMNFFNPSVSSYPGNRSNAFSVRCIKD